MPESPDLGLMPALQQVQVLSLLAHLWIHPESPNLTPHIFQHGLECRGLIQIETKVPQRGVLFFKAHGHHSASEFREPGMDNANTMMVLQ